MASLYRATYLSWRDMHRRCQEPDKHNYHRYGGRGITVCERWATFALFLEDMGIKPERSLQLERVKNDEGYFKDNCRWATAKEQANNRHAMSVMTRNRSGIPGVRFREDRRKWIAEAYIERRWIQLYRGTHFFEACCARKSWEARNATSR